MCEGVCIVALSQEVLAKTEIQEGASLLGRTRQYLTV